MLFGISLTFGVIAVLLVVALVLGTVITGVVLLCSLLLHSIIGLPLAPVGITWGIATVFSLVVCVGFCWAGVAASEDAYRRSGD